MSKFSIYLRPFKEDDAILINKWRNDHSLQKMTGGPIRFVSLEIEKNWVREKMLDNQKDLYLAICLNDGSDRMIGYISLNNIDHHNKKLESGGCIIGEKDCRDGISLFESIYLILDYAFMQLNMNRVTASCLPDHFMAPLHLAVFGFEKEGRLKEEVYKNGRYYDVDLYAIMRRDFVRIKDEGGYDISKLIRRFRSLLKNREK